MGIRSGWSELYDLPSNPAAGGAGGGGGGDPESGSSNEYGGDGGAGGGMIILVAPEIEVNGNIDVSGEDGENGDPGDGGSNCGADGAGGGGAGGAGGLFYTISESSSINGETDISGGENGTGGTPSGWAHSGGNGAEGAEGVENTVTIENLAFFFCDVVQENDTCKINSTHSIPEDAYNIETDLIVDPESRLTSTGFPAFNIPGRLQISGKWQGGFNFNTTDAVLKSGTELLPNGNTIKIGR